MNIYRLLIITMLSDKKNVLPKCWASGIPLYTNTLNNKGSFLILHGTSFNNISILSNTLFLDMIGAKNFIKEYLINTFDKCEILDYSEKLHIMEKANTGTLLLPDDVVYYIFNNNTEYEIVQFRKIVSTTTDERKCIVMETHKESRFSFLSGYYTVDVETPVEKIIESTTVAEIIEDNIINKFKIITIHTTDNITTFDKYINKFEHKKNLNKSNIGFQSDLLKKRNEIINKKSIADFDKYIIKR